MATSSNPEEQVHTFLLGEVIDISMVNSLYDGLRILLNEAKTVVIDARNVKRMDTAALQLLCCWYKEARARNITVSWRNIEGVFKHSSDLLGLSDELALA